MKEKAMSDMADTAMKNYEQAVRAGLKMQEEAGKWWTNMFNQGVGDDWQKRLGTMTSGFVPLAQKRMEEMMELMQKNGRTSAELMKKAMEAAQTPMGAESQAKWMDFWTSSMGAMRSSTEAMTQINNKAVEGWINYIRKNAEFPEMQTRPAR